jgi:rubrerythrin
MNNGVVKITQQINQIGNFDSFTIMGDPGCDGLGAEIMTTFAKGLTAAPSDFAVILGDIVPVNKEILYQRMAEFINLIAPYPVYLLCGNHDTSNYEQYFGLRNYLLVNDRVLFIVLDNSRRKFDEAALAFLKDSLKNHSRDNIMLLFHIPPPNRISRNAVTAEEWEKTASIYRPYKQKIKYILSGHVHTFFEDVIDGIPLIVSGGAGARLEKVDAPIDIKKAFHHVLRFYFDNKGKLVFEHITLDGKLYENELADSDLKQMLLDAFQEKSESYVKYRVFAEDAMEKGLDGTAKLFRAVAESEFCQARNHFNNLNYLNTVLNNLEGSQKTEELEIREKSPAYLSLTEKKRHGLARYSFFESLEADKAHQKLLLEALPAVKTGADIETAKYYTCTSCGLTVKADEPPKNCPVCGAPFDKIIEVV